jgi:hypothetical protein
MENHLNFPSFVAYLRSSSSVPYSALLLRVHKGELVVFFLHFGVLARPGKQLTSSLLPSSRAPGSSNPKERTGGGYLGHPLVSGGIRATGIVHGPADDELHGWAEGGPCDAFFVFSFLLFFGLVLDNLHIILTS